MQRVSLVSSEMRFEVLSTPLVIEFIRSVSVSMWKQVGVPYHVIHRDCASGCVVELASLFDALS